MRTNIVKADFLPGSLYVDVPMTGVAVRRFQSDARFLAAVMCPRLIVKKPSGLYTVVSMADLNRDEMAPRGPTAPAERAAWGYSNATFSTDARSLEYDVNDAAQAASDVERNPDVIIPRVLAYKALIHTERRLATTFFSSAAWYRTVTGASSDSGSEGTTTMDRLYFDNENADIVEAITEEMRLQSILTGMMPTGLALGSRLWHKIRNSAKIKSQIVGLAGGSIGNAVIAMGRQALLPEFAALCGLQWVGVSEAIYNSAGENQTATNALIVPQDDAVLFYSATAGQADGDAMMTVDSDEPTALARFVWNGVASGEGIQIRKVRDEKAGPGGSFANIIDVYNGFGVITPECGTYLTGMVTP